MKAKHTKEHAEKLSKEYSLIIHDQIAFENGYLKAIEETNHVEVLEALKEAKDTLYASEFDKAFHHYGCDDKAEQLAIRVAETMTIRYSEAIRKAEEELKEDSHDPNCYHNCELCGSKCNCSDQPCSCCKEELNQSKG